MNSAPRRKVIFFVTVDWYFYQHYLPLAVALRDAGYSVAVMTEVIAHGERITAAGLRLIPIRIDRKGLNPFVELYALARIVRVLLRERPDLLHNIAQKPVLYGTIAAKLARIPAVYNALGGLGYVFTANDNKARTLRSFLVGAYRVLLTRPSVRVAVQNPDDAALLSRWVHIEPVLIRGAGVNLAQFAPTSEPPPPVTVLLASRLLWDKGLAEFVEAARILQARGVPARFVIVGKPDDGNPASLTKAQLDEWHASGAVEWWGYREDMAGILAATHIVCLPSYYREGIPKILLEALAAARPIVTTDHPGCRETVREGENGFLVPTKNAIAVANALQSLILDAGLRRRFGERSRALAEAEFGFEQVAARVLSLYRELLREPQC